MQLPHGRSCIETRSKSCLASNDSFEVASVCWRYYYYKKQKKKMMMIFLLFQFFVSTAALLEAARRLGCNGWTQGIWPPRTVTHTMQGVCSLDFLSSVTRQKSHWTLANRRRRANLSRKIPRSWAAKWASIVKTYQWKFGCCWLVCFFDPDNAGWLHFKLKLTEVW